MVCSQKSSELMCEIFSQSDVLLDRQLPARYSFDFRQWSIVTFWSYVMTHAMRSSSQSRPVINFH